MCSGKTTLGVALAKECGFSFIDLDEEIERESGMSVSEIFARLGEAAFRALERAALERAVGLGDAVVACGGGTPCRPGAMELMNAAGDTVYLKPSESRLLPRLMQGRSKRPKIAAISSDAEMLALVRDMISEREPFYALAKHEFDSSWLETTEEIAASVARFRQMLSL